MKQRSSCCSAAGLGVAAIVLAGCAPTFESDGTLMVGSSAFRPTTCHVLTRATGIELGDGSGRRLVLTLPPQRLDAFRDITGAPSVQLEPGGASASACGTLTLTGEGYHGSGKRAASGKLALSCDDPPGIHGELSLRGCF